MEEAFDMSNICMCEQQTVIIFYSVCWPSTVVCIDQAGRVVCFLSHCVFISPSIHSQGFIVNMVLLLGDTATFISCLSYSSEGNKMGGREVCCFSTCARQHNALPPLRYYSNRPRVSQAACIMKNISGAGEDLYLV